MLHTANLTKQTKMVLGLGFDKDLTKDVVNKLNQKPLKSNTQVLNQVNASEYYMILANDTQFTIHSAYHVNKYEITRIAKIVGLSYINCGTLIDNNGLWLEWIKYPTIV